MRNFAVLAGAGDPLFGYYLKAIECRGLRPVAIIVDQKAMTPKDQAIFAERTLGRILPMPPLELPRERYHFVSSHNDEDTLKLICDSGVDFIVSAGTPRILREPILKVTPFGVMNCHPGLLPEFRGCSCVEWAIYLDRPLGVTVHRMTEGIDEGPVLLRRQFDVTDGDRYEDVRIKAYMEACSALADASLCLSNGRLNESSFINQSGGRYFPPITPDQLKTVKDKLAVGAYRPKDML